MMTAPIAPMITIISAAMLVNIATGSAPFMIMPTNTPMRTMMKPARLATSIGSVLSHGRDDAELGRLQPAGGSRDRQGAVGALAVGHDLLEDVLEGLQHGIRVAVEEPQDRGRRLLDALEMILVDGEARAIQARHDDHDVDLTGPTRPAA